MEIDHYSEEWDNAPMPYSIFFTQTGNAIHGTYEQRNLGRAVSHGCVRLSVKNAATLWGLVKHENGQHQGGDERLDPRCRTADGGAFPADAFDSDAPLYRAPPPPQYQPVYVARPPLPSPFFIFGR